jgi:hypothetical protein
MPDYERSPSEPQRSWLERWARSLRIVGPKDRGAHAEEAFTGFLSEVDLQERELRGAALAPASRPQQLRRRSSMLAALIVLAILAVAEGVVLAFLLVPRVVADGKAVGSVVVTSTPPGATVHVNDVVVGTTPYKGDLEPGAHRVAVKQGDTTWSEEIAISRDAEAAVHVAWPTERTAPATRVKTGMLRITTEPSGLHVSVDGRPRGASPLTVANLAAGTHKVTVTGRGGVTTREVSLGDGETSSLLISTAAPAPTLASGWFSVVLPVPAQIYERGVLLGTTDVPRIMVPAGLHQLEIVNAALGLKTQRSLQVVEGRTAVLDIEVPNGVVAINALPWAEVSVGSRALGQTPLANVPLPIGHHEIVFRHPELGERRRSVVVTVGQKVRVGIDMR